MMYPGSIRYPTYVRSISVQPADILRPNLEFLATWVLLKNGLLWRFLNKVSAGVGQCSRSTIFLNQIWSISVDVSLADAGENRRETYHFDKHNRFESDDFFEKVSSWTQVQPYLEGISWRWTWIDEICLLYNWHQFWERYQLRSDDFFRMRSSSTLVLPPRRRIIGGCARNRCDPSPFQQESHLWRAGVSSAGVLPLGTILLKTSTSDYGIES